MPESKFLSMINGKKHLVSDGATGTSLMARGLPGGITAETWVLEQPDKIIQLHQDFISAGADIILTSTFNGSPIRLKGTKLDGKTGLVNRKAVELARKAADGTEVFVGGSLGPLGQLMKPYGPLSPEEVRNAYMEQARFISESGADLLVVETQYDLGEVKAAVEGVRSVSELPLVVSLSYDRGKRTMMGVSPAQAARELENMPVDFIGINCGRSLDENFQNLVELRQATTKPTWFKPNAGLPRVDGQGNTIYDTTPQMMADYVPQWLEAGAQILGGCCGTSPEHLREIAARVKGQKN